MRMEFMKIRDYIKEHVVLTDGAMGTYYASLVKEPQAMSEYANLSDLETIRNIHREYIEAGANLIRTNTFVANTVSMVVDKETRDHMIRQATTIAKEEAKKATQPVFVAGSIGPIPEHATYGEEEVLEEYKEICDVFLQCQVDVIVFETFHDLYYIKPIVDYIRKQSDVFIITNFCLNKNGYTKAGISANRLALEVNDMPEIDAFGFNCGIGSGHMLSLFDTISFPQNKYIVAMPNAGYPEQMQYRMVFRDNAVYFEENMRKLVEAGVNIIGGCCGTTPEYIASMSRMVQSAKRKGSLPIVLKGSHTLVREQRENDFYKLFDAKKKVIAVELDPPYDAQYEKLIELAHKVKSRGADIITLADSPMGRSRVDSILMSVKIAKEVEMPVMPHVCCRDKNMIAMRSGLLGAYINGIRNLLVVTGDPVPSVSRSEISSVFDYNSIRLMQFVKEMNEEHFCEEPFYFGGALNYARGNIDKVIERMKKKIEAGAKYFLTQPVYSDEDINRLRYIKEHVDTKLLCGVMPFVSYRNANFVKNEFTGIFVPDEILNRYHPDMSKEEAEWVGAEIANEIIAKMDDFADGYYFMLPFNRVSLLDKITWKE